mmetsp:Transcript_11443/g.34752  ORF Transcript_11443/g.34752 Transcript_11443/m.34752 type:complete len:372 (-) Transcript_11443:98-1213(-)
MSTLADLGDMEPCEGTETVSVTRGADGAEGSYAVQCNLVSGDQGKLITSVDVTAPGSAAEPLQLEVTCPKQQDLHIAYEDNAKGDVTVTNKVEGDVVIGLGHGSLELAGARGEKLNLSAPAGRIDVAGLLEGDVSLLSRDGLYVQKMNSPTAQARTEGPLRAQAIYAARVDLEAGAELDVDSVHGDAYISAGGTLRIGGITGSARQLTSGGDADVHIDVVDAGAGAMRIDAGGDLKLSLADELTRPPQHLTLEATQREGAPDIENVQLLEPPSPCVDAEGYVVHRGKMTSTDGGSGDGAPARVDGKGKIDIEGAAAQRLDAFFSDRSAGRAAADEGAPTLNVRAESVGVEVLSWKDRVYRNFKAKREPCSA